MRVFRAFRHYLVRVPRRNRALRIPETLGPTVFVQLIARLIVVGTFFISAAGLRVLAHCAGLGVLLHLFTIRRGRILYLVLLIRRGSLFKRKAKLFRILVNFFLWGIMISESIRYLCARELSIRVFFGLFNILSAILLLRFSRIARFRMIRVLLLKRLFHVRALLVLTVGLRILAQHAYHGILHDLVTFFVLIFVCGWEVLSGVGEIFIGEPVRIPRSHVWTRSKKNNRKDIRDECNKVLCVVL